MILVAGGDADPNLGSLLERAEARGIPHRMVGVGAEGNPSLVWDLQADRLVVDGVEVHATGAFIRYDVFTQMQDKRPAVAARASAWFTTLHGWMMAHDGVRLLNRDVARQMNKPFYLALAQRSGLEIPETLVTNDVAALEARSAERRMIAKPVTGGGYTKPLEELLGTVESRDGRTASPAIVQERLEQPEVRIYGVGGRFLPFAVRSAALDYRDADDTRVEPLSPGDVDPALLAGLERLMGTLGMTYGAADFKTDPVTGRLRFLEINASPMFVGFDRVSDHAVSDAILDFIAPGR